MLRAGMMAQALSSAGEVRNGSSRIKLGVCLRGMGCQISAVLVGFKKRLRHLRSDPPA
jgi:hypothetical protein